MSPDGTHADTARLQAAFPASIRADISTALTLMPVTSSALPNGPLLSPNSIGSNRKRYPLTIAGEPIEVPYRIYHDSPALDVAGLQPMHRTILGCIYTRHHDGLVRQRWLHTVLEAEQPWTAPFVIQLLSEYVLDIINDIDCALRSRRCEIYERFVAENPHFHALALHRATSYWNAYHRSLYPPLCDYPAYSLLSALAP